MADIKIDSPSFVRPGEELDLAKLNAYLQAQLPTIELVTEVAQFPGGYSNLTYLLKTIRQEYVLRRPPFGAKDIKGGHDMGREFRVISSLKAAGFRQVPTPVIFCESYEVIGCPFYIMERVQGIILRAKDAPKLLQTPPAEMQKLSEALCDNLVNLHSIDIYQANEQQPALINLGKPEGYIQRQVEGWYKRYQNSQTDEIKGMEELVSWLNDNRPTDGQPTLIHNDFKYDNVVLNPNDWSEIIAVLDWEMTTVGDPLMDLGTALSYWAEATDGDFEKTFNLSWLAGNLTRQKFADRYAAKSGRDISGILYFYVFGLFKNSVVIQQIYSRFKKGLTHDQRFSTLNYGVRALSEKAVKAIIKGRI